MRRQGASIFVYLIFCLLIAIFVINFRPGQSRQDDNGCRGVSNVVISVAGNEATQTAYKIAYSNPYNRGTGKQKTYVALETLIRREILADAAEARGLLTTNDLMIEEIKKGHFFLGGQKTMIPGAFEEVDGEKFYSQKAVKGWMGQMNVSANSYIEEQRRGLLASMMSEILAESVQVSREEALSQFLYEGNTATYDVVAFKPELYRSAMRITDADVDRYLASHTDEIEKRYKSDERTYKGVKPQLQLREIFIAKAEPKAAEAPKPDDKTAKPDDKKPDDKTAKKDDKKPDVKPVGMPIDDAKAKLEAVRTAAATNKQKFIDAAKELSTDDSAKSVGGEIGWHGVDNGMLGDKAVNDAIKSLKPGEMTPVIATDRGVYLILAEAKREGDLSYEQVKHELAKQLAIDTWSKEAAKRAAIAALDHARNGVGMNLDQLYDRELAPSQPDVDFQKIISDPNLTNEQKQEILQKLIQQNRHGSLELLGKDQPAGWFADTAEAGSAATPPATPRPHQPDRPRPQIRSTGEARPRPRPRRLRHRSSRNYRRRRISCPRWVRSARRTSIVSVRRRAAPRCPASATPRKPRMPCSTSSRWASSRRGSITPTTHTFSCSWSGARSRTSPTSTRKPTIASPSCARAAARRSSRNGSRTSARHSRRTARSSRMPS